ncbi:MAG TPA: ABC transporter permease [Lacunisphaera sp.]|nr:ABC transporter permease [Lacunisphaera sp.]
MSSAQDTAPSVQGDVSGSTGAGSHWTELWRQFGQLRRAPVSAVLWQQVRRGALGFFWLAAALGALAGFFTLITVESGFGLGITIGVRVLQELVLGQLAGFAAALLLVAGPGLAGVFELALMRQQGELRVLRLIGIDPHDLLVLPRALGFAGSLMVLAFSFQLAAVLGGFALTALFSSASFTPQMIALAGMLPPWMLVVSAVRSLVLGGVIGLLVCHQGLVAPFSPTRMPQIARQFLSRALVAFVLVHGVFALLMS